MVNSSVKKPARLRLKTWIKPVTVVLWLIVAVFFLQHFLVAVMVLLRDLGFVIADTTASRVSLDTVYRVLLIAMVIAVPWLTIKHRTSLRELGLQRSLSWTDISVSILAFMAYFILSAVVLYLAVTLIPIFDINQTQELGVRSSLYGVELIMAFMLFAVVAPISEEIIMRGWLFGKLKRYHVPFWINALIGSLLFAVAHGQWNVGVDVFVLSMVLSFIREKTGSIWAGVLVHMIKNIIAFYLVFVR